MFEEVDLDGIRERMFIRYCTEDISLEYAEAIMGIDLASDDVGANTPVKERSKSEGQAFLMLMKMQAASFKLMNEDASTEDIYLLYDQYFKEVMGMDSDVIADFHKLLSADSRYTLVLSRFEKLYTPKKASDRVEG